MPFVRARNLAVIAVALSVLILVLAPVPMLSIGTPDGKLFFRRPIAPGQSIVLRYIHSVQRTPVEDEYKVTGGTLWQWEERVVSHNAGLPVEASPQGTFLQTDEWMIFRGGGNTFSPLYYRVGNEKLGRNKLFVPPCCGYDLYQRIPNVLLRIDVGYQVFPWARTQNLFEAAQ